LDRSYTFVNSDVVGARLGCGVVVGTAVGDGVEAGNGCGVGTAVGEATIAAIEGSASDGAPVVKTTLFTFCQHLILAEEPLRNPSIGA
jgi:hypothetical protein